MDQIQFVDFNEAAGVGDLLFVNMDKPDQYRFYRRRNEWDECYMVEFSTKSDEYKLYWGQNEEERSKLDATELLLPSYPTVNWKRIKLNPLFVHNLPQILESVEITISRQAK